MQLSSCKASMKLACITFLTASDYMLRGFAPYHAHSKCRNIIQKQEPLLTSGLLTLDMSYYSSSENHRTKILFLDTGSYCQLLIKISNLSTTNSSQYAEKEDLRGISLQDLVPSTTWKTPKVHLQENYFMLGAREKRFYE